MMADTSGPVVMTMRDQFAMHAVRTCWEAGFVIPAGSTLQDGLAKAAYLIADAMIAERERQGGAR